MSGNSVTQTASNVAGNLANNVNSAVNTAGATISSANSAVDQAVSSNKALSAIVNPALPAAYGLSDWLQGLYNGVKGGPSSPTLQNPAAAGAPPTQASAAATGIAATQAVEKQQASWAGMGGGGFAGASLETPTTTSRTLLGS